ncbi:MAG: hypothetical protein GC158_05630 [Cyanobacteria bacterium RI_101]|nr:hypothetical protein [Cyanobacteria bacterium RI_101]
MTRSLSRLEAELAELETHTETLYQRLCQVYCQYLRGLSAQLERELSLAAHQVCTRLYPEEFLNLSLEERRELQGKIQTLARQLEPRLQERLGRRGVDVEGWTRSPEPTAEAEEAPEPDREPEEALELDVEGFLNQQEERKDGEGEEEEKGEEEEEDGADAFLNKLSALAKSGELMEMILQRMERDREPQWTYPISDPDALAAWGSAIEQILERTLQEISLEANQILQGVKIIPPVLPGKVLEVALRAEESGMAFNRDKNPYILNLIVEMTPQGEKDEEEDKSEEDQEKSRQLLKFIALRFRANDLEFQDGALTGARKQIRHLAEQLKKLHKHYRERRREKLTREAEQAWRSTWIPLAPSHDQSPPSL